MASRLVIILILLGMVFSFNARYGGELYHDGKNARNSALGGLSVSFEDGCNPVLLKNENTPSIHFSHKNKFGGLAQVAILSYLYIGRKYPLYIGLTNRSVDNIPITLSACDISTLNCNYSEIDYFSQQEIGIQLSTIRFWGPYTLGFNLKPSFIGLAEFGKGYGFSGDLAVMLQSSDDLAITLQLDDIMGLKYWDSGTLETISPLLTAGIYFQGSKLRLGIETGTRIESNTFLHYRVGFEYIQQEQLYFRIGTSHYNQFTAGFGIRIPLIDFSYAYLYPYTGSPFDESHIISAGINLGAVESIKGKITP